MFLTDDLKWILKMRKVSKKVLQCLDQSIVWTHLYCEYFPKKSLQMLKEKEEVKEEAKSLSNELRDTLF